MTSHAVPARVVDDDQVRATRLRKLRGDAGAGARPDNRVAVFQLGVKSVQYLLAGIAHGFLLVITPLSGRNGGGPSEAYSNQG